MKLVGHTDIEFAELSTACLLHILHLLGGKRTFTFIRTGTLVQVQTEAHLSGFVRDRTNMISDKKQFETNRNRKRLLYVEA